MMCVVGVVGCLLFGADPATAFVAVSMALAAYASFMKGLKD